MTDPMVWKNQTNALIDRREMVEIKHGLNVRRQKIREKMASCEKIRQNATAALKASIAANPGIESYIRELLATYNCNSGLQIQNKRSLIVYFYTRHHSYMEEERHG